jgi:hypothetical protein
VTVNGKAYAYPPTSSPTRSEDIKRLFCDALDRLGVEWRVMTASDISIAKRASVARLDAFVGGSGERAEPVSRASTGWRCAVPRSR